MLVAPFSFFRGERIGAHGAPYATTVNDNVKLYQFRQNKSVPPVKVNPLRAHRRSMWAVGWSKSLYRLQSDPIPVVS